MKVSVLMSTYNGEKFILNQLESLLSQSRKIDELIVVDDCSNDNTVAIVNSFIDRHHLNDIWKVFVNEKNLGWRINFMNGIQKTTGDILMFSDQDDIWLDNKVEIVLDVLKNEPQIQVVASNETIWNGEPVEKTYITSNTFDVIELSATGDNYFIRCSGCTMAIRRSYIDRILQYHKDGWAHDDFFWRMAGIDGALALIQESTILHRIHGTNESRKKRTLSSSITGIQTELIIAEQLLKYMRDNVTHVGNIKNKIDVVTHKKEGNVLRLHLLRDKKLSFLPALVFRYADIYRRKRQILKDLLLALEG